MAPGAHAESPSFLSLLPISPNSPSAPTFTCHQAGIGQVSRRVDPRSESQLLASKRGVVQDVEIFTLSVADRGHWQLISPDPFSEPAEVNPENMEGSIMLWQSPLQRWNSMLLTPLPILEREEWIPGTQSLVVMGIPRSVTSDNLSALLKGLWSGDKYTYQNDNLFDLIFAFSELRDAEHTTSGPLRRSQIRNLGNIIVHLLFGDEGIAIQPLPLSYPRTSCLPPTLPGSSIPAALATVVFPSEESAKDFWIEFSSGDMRAYGHTIKTSPDPSGFGIYAEALACFYPSEIIKVGDTQIFDASLCVSLIINKNYPLESFCPSLHNHSSILDVQKKLIAFSIKSFWNEDKKCLQLDEDDLRRNFTQMPNLYHTGFITPQGGHVLATMLNLSESLLPVISLIPPAVLSAVLASSSAMTNEITEFHSIDCKTGQNTINTSRSNSSVVELPSKTKTALKPPVTVNDYNADKVIEAAHVSESKASAPVLQNKERSNVKQFETKKDLHITPTAVVASRTSKFKKIVSLPPSQIQSNLYEFTDTTHSRSSSTQVLSNSVSSKRMLRVVTSSDSDTSSTDENSDPDSQSSGTVSDSNASGTNVKKHTNASKLDNEQASHLKKYASNNKEKKRESSFSNSIVTNYNAGKLRKTQNGSKKVYKRKNVTNSLSKYPKKRSKMECSTESAKSIKEQNWQSILQGFRRSGRLHQEYTEELVELGYRGERVQITRDEPAAPTEFVSQFSTAAQTSHVNDSSDSHKLPVKRFFKQTKKLLQKCAENSIADPLSWDEFYDYKFQDNYEQLPEVIQKDVKISESTIRNSID